MALQQLPFFATGCVNRLAWSSDGTMLVSGSDDRTLGLWRYPEPAQHLMVDTEHVCVSAHSVVPRHGHSRHSMKQELLLAGSKYLWGQVSWEPARRVGRDGRHCTGTILLKCQAPSEQGIQVRSVATHLFSAQLHMLDAAPGSARSGRARDGTAAGSTIVYRCHESRVKASPAAASD